MSEEDKEQIEQAEQIEIDRTNQNMEVIDKALTVFRGFYLNKINQKELINELINIDKASKLEIEKQIFDIIVSRLKHNPMDTHYYDIDKIPKGMWLPLKSIISLLRIKELKNVKVVKRKRKYDIKELRRSFYGKMILQELETEIGHRWMLSKSEYEAVQLQCRKLNLKLPEIIQPTRTEKLFEVFYNE